MNASRLAALLLCWPLCAGAGAAAEHLPQAHMFDHSTSDRPVANAAFAPGPDAKQAAPLSVTLRIAAGPLHTLPDLRQPVLGGRDARLFPGVTLSFVSQGGTLVPVERGTMVREDRPGAVPSYWRVIPQFGRVWREPADVEWSRAAFPVMLVNDTENHAHQGLATFLYRNGEVSDLRVQFVQQTAPYLLAPHCVLWGTLSATASALDPARAAATRQAADVELAARLPARPLAELEARLPKDTLAGLGGPVLPKWQVAVGLVYQGTLYYAAQPTAYGDYPYPLEMRFGVRSVMKSVAAPLSLLHLAELYGPGVLDERIGDYVPGLDPKWREVRFIDAANMATGFGGTGTFRTQPNDMYDGYLEADYDGWYTAPSVAAKLEHINEHLKPYPWAPGKVVRYRDQDFFLLGLAIDGYLKRKRGPDTDAWDVLRREVLQPVGIVQAPAVRTREPDGRDGPVWFNAGYYPSLDDLAKIALLYEHLGAQGGKQLLHRELTRRLLAAEGALDKTGDGSPQEQSPPPTQPRQLYAMGFHFTPYTPSRSKTLHYLPTMSGFGDNEVILVPNGIVAIRAAKVAEVPDGESAKSADELATPRAVDRLAPF